MKESTKVLALATVVLLMILLPAEEFARRELPTQAYRLYAGFVLSIISTTAFAVFVNVLQTYRRGGSIGDVDSNKWTRPFSIIAILVLFLFGLLIFWASWEGKGTGIWYGIGFFLGALLTEAGVGRTIKSG